MVTPQLKWAYHYQQYLNQAFGLLIVMPAMVMITVSM